MQLVPSPVKVLVTRASRQAKILEQALQAIGAVPITVPLLAFRTRNTSENQALLKGLEKYSWLVFSSANGVYHLRQLADSVGCRLPLAGQRIAVVGEKTAKAAEEHFSRKPELVPYPFDAKTLGEALQKKQGKMLLVQGNLSRDTLEKQLSQGHLSYQKMIVYDTVTEENNKYLLNQKLITEQPEVLSFTSPSAIAAFFELLEPEARAAIMDRICLVIGSTTKKEAEKHGFAAILMPEVYTAEAMAAELATYYQNRLGEKNE